MKSALYPPIPSNELLRKFSGHILGLCMAQLMTPEKFAEICHAYGYRFIYGSGLDMRIPGITDDRPQFWVYMTDLFNPKAPATISPIL